MKKEISSGPKITYTELMRDLDKYRPNITKRRIFLTKEQEEFIIKCTANKYPVSRRRMAALWEQLGWGKISKYAIETRIDLLKGEGKL